MSTMLAIVRIGYLVNWHLNKYAFCLRKKGKLLFNDVDGWHPTILMMFFVHLLDAITGPREMWSGTVGIALLTIHATCCVYYFVF